MSWPVVDLNVLGWPLIVDLGILARRGWANVSVAAVELKTLVWRRVIIDLDDELGGIGAMSEYPSTSSSGLDILAVLPMSNLESQLRRR